MDFQPPAACSSRSVSARGFSPSPLVMDSLRGQAPASDGLVTVLYEEALGWNSQ